MSDRYPRRPPRLAVVFDAHKDAPVYFVSFCTYRRRPWLARPELHEAFCQFAHRGWRERQIGVGRYVLMPEHIHLLVCGGADFALGEWVKLLKQCLGKAICASRKGTPHRGVATPRERLWQEGFFDRLIRRDEKLADVWEYLCRNPLTAGLSTTPADWPYQGEIVPVDRA
ncbi:MAG TPA: transposase [Verrucomicrobiae bacterium]|nr:transposase [Verrucomicrobiae bacterium]